jgi:hypothetical protein
MRAKHAQQLTLDFNESQTNIVLFPPCQLFNIGIFLAVIGLAPFLDEPGAWAGPDGMPFIRRDGNTLPYEHEGQ